MVEVKGAQSEPAPKARGTLALPQATALIVASIIGAAIVDLPHSLASIGPIGVVTMALTTLGALALAVLVGLDHRVGGNRGDRRRVPVLRRGVRQREPCSGVVGGDRADRPADPGRGQSGRPRTSGPSNCGTPSSN